MYRIPLRELKTKKVRITISKPRQQVKQLLTTHVVDARRSQSNGEVFYVHMDEAKRAKLEAWQKLEKAFKKRNKDL